MADDAAPDGESGDTTPEGDAAAVEAAVDEEATDNAEEVEDDTAVTAKTKMSHVRLATIRGLVAVVALAALCGWLGFRTYESRKAADERNLFLQVGRQAALNL